MKSYIAKGKRSLVYKIKYNGKVCAFKVKRMDSKAQGNIAREYQLLRLLNRCSIGPRVYAWKNGIVMELIKGKRIGDFFASASRDEIIEVLDKLLEKLRQLDRLGFSKEELVNPYKHIIVTDKGPRLIDFERCHESKEPQNITQFVSYLTSRSNMLAGRGVFILMGRLIKLCRLYKHSQSNKNYENIRAEILQQGLLARVYYATSGIPPGKVSSYKALGDAIGSKAYRAIGNALHSNPFWPIVPCHRVVNENGMLGGFARGREVKKRLLKAEGIRIINGKIPKAFFIPPAFYS